MGIIHSMPYIGGIMKEVFEFLSGAINANEFHQMLADKPEILDWLQSLIPEGLTDIEDPFWQSITDRVMMPSVGFRIRNYLSDYMDLKTVAGRCCVYSLFYQLVSTKYSSVEATTKYQDEYGLLLDVMPDYIDGKEAEELIGRILDNIPMTKSKGDRRKLLKAAIKKAFHLTDNSKYPRWVQAAEWPFHNGRPMKFVVSEHKKNDEKYSYLFVDPESGLQKTVEQYW